MFGLRWNTVLVLAIFKTRLILGGELYDYLLKHKRLKEPTAQRMFTQLCGAVAYIHKAGCVHRYQQSLTILIPGI